MHRAPTMMKFKNLRLFERSEFQMFLNFIIAQWPKLEPSPIIAYMAWVPVSSYSWQNHYLSTRIMCKSITLVFVGPVINKSSSPAKK